jgi:hypothetical protein
MKFNFIGLKQLRLERSNLKFKTIIRTKVMTSGKEDGACIARVIE